jgi:recombinational DNA repair ATPase RecF
VIQLQLLAIRDFRGIRDLKLDLKGENFAACGPNGTGKSGIVDAIEFALTGNISRLSGAGTGGLSVKAHGPHVDFRNKPEQSSVTLGVFIPSTGQTATIHRTVKAAGTPVITPNSPDIVAAFENARLHPEFVLSRRELIRYVVSEPGARSKEVQALLRLDDIEKLRGVLNKIANDAKKELAPLGRGETDSTTALLGALGITQLNKTSLLAAANTRRAELSLSALESLEPTTSLKDGLSGISSGNAVSKVPKAQAQSDLAALHTALTKLSSQECQLACSAALATANDLAKDATSLDGVAREALLQSALNLYDEEVCPVCDTPVAPAAFRDHVDVKLVHLAEIATKRRTLDEQLAPILNDIHAAGSALAVVIAHGPHFTPVLGMTELAAFKATLLGRYGQLGKVLPMSDTIAMLPIVHQVPDLSVTISAVAAAVAAIPEPSKQDAAREFLTVAQERLEVWRNARLKVAAAEARAARAAKAYAIYADVTTKALETIYKNVEGTFATLYGEINKEDEASFTAKLIPSIGKLGFDVDFYGRGHFPPGAYHSEGHQDGMGLCLYLALMKHLQGENFRFAVLDDVLMSVDAGHRREVCSVLKKHFPQTQFIFTTHDEIWLRHMKSEGLIKGKNAAHFRTWTVDFGPKEWNNHDVWAEISGYLGQNDVRGAAALLRHFLEHFAGEACHRLRAKVEFRGDAQFTLGDLLPNAVSALGGLFKKAKEAANSWGQQEVVAAIAARDAAFANTKSKANFDSWQLNTAVHFNAWDNLQKQDFDPVVDSFRDLIGQFSCSTCGEMYGAKPERGSKIEVLKCGCGSTNLNLLAK